MEMGGSLWAQTPGGYEVHMGRSGADLVERFPFGVSDFLKMSRRQAGYFFELVAQVSYARIV